MENEVLAIQQRSSAEFAQPFRSAFYQVLLFEGNERFCVDFTEYEASGPTVLFLSPYQTLQWKSPQPLELHCLSFHGDFYCIEYHKKEVACNGLLFNNVYLFPHIRLPRQGYREVQSLFQKMKKEQQAAGAFSAAILKAYLQLILALCSKQKSLLLADTPVAAAETGALARFQELLEQQFRTEKGVSFYAAQLALSTSAFSKKIKKLFGKTPQQLIQDRVVLEAKKLLHLTHRSVKEIAADLHFEDEYYFSRYFKKSVQLSPLHYRERVGISIVAK